MSTVIVLPLLSHFLLWTRTGMGVVSPGQGSFLLLGCLKQSSPNDAQDKEVGHVEPIPKPTPLIRLIYGLIFGWFLLESGVGLDDPHGSLPTWEL